MVHGNGIAWVGVLLSAAACGRIGYDPTSAANEDAAPNLIDAMAVDATACEFDGGFIAPVLQDDWTRADTGSSAVTSLSIPVPAGTQEGDLIVLVLTVDDSGLVPVTPAGFVQVFAIEGGARHTAVHYRIAGIAEPAFYLATWGSDDQAIGYALRITGAHPTTPIGNFSSSLANSDAATFDAMNTSSDDSLVFATVATPTNNTICGEWSAPFTTVDCHFNDPNDNASVAFNTYTTAGTAVAPIFDFLNPPDSHAATLFEILPGVSCGP